MLSYGSLTHARVNIFASGGLATNTIPGKMYLAYDKKLAIAPVTEIVFFNDLKSIKIGLIARYGSLNIVAKPRFTPGREFSYRNIELAKNVFSVMINLGKVFNAGRCSLSPSAEFGLAFNEKKNGIAVGLRFDATYRITKHFGLLAGTSGTMYKIKNNAIFYFPLKAGVAFNL